MIKEKDLLNKISELLSLPFDQECRVLHLMVEIRKFLEYNEEQEKFQTLAFYCDWCVHTKLERKLANDKLTEIEKYFGDDDEINNDMFSNFLKFSELKDELIIFFKESDLESVTFFNNWNKFLKNLVNILANCPLIRKPKKKKELKPGEIKKIYFEKTIQEDGQLMCNIDFEKDNKGIHKGFLVGII
jgi:hypothetical protein